ncbi:unnamed protein product [Xylocopa violacea]|uniref:Uncharacterized protein n=1 Tax=Xylocopa violacea TaxID=135666 RepID=A0ABP1NSE0_XYLVO
MKKKLIHVRHPLRLKSLSLHQLTHLTQMLDPSAQNVDATKVIVEIYGSSNARMEPHQIQHYPEQHVASGVCKAREYFLQAFFRVPHLCQYDQDDNIDKQSNISDISTKSGPSKTDRSFLLILYIY